MKTEKELADWLDSNMPTGDFYALPYREKTLTLFKGMKLVPADAAVLTLEDAEFLLWACGDVLDDAVGRLTQAIIQAKGARQ